MSIKIFDMQLINKFKSTFQDCYAVHQEIEPTVINPHKIMFSRQMDYTVLSSLGAYRQDPLTVKDGIAGFEVIMCSPIGQEASYIKIMTQAIDMVLGRYQCLSNDFVMLMPGIYKDGLARLLFKKPSEVGLGDLSVEHNGQRYEWLVAFLITEDEYKIWWKRGFEGLVAHSTVETLMNLNRLPNLFEEEEPVVHPPARQVAYEYFSNIEGVSEPPIKYVITKNLNSIGIIVTEEEVEYYVQEGEEEEEYMNSVLYCTVGWSDIPTNRVNDGLPVRNEIVFYGHKRIPEYNEMVISILDEIAGKGDCLYEDLVIENAFDRYGVDLGKSDMKHLVFMLPHQVSECTKSFFCAEGCLQFLMPEPISDKELEYLKEHGSYKLFWDKISETDRDDVGTFWRMCSFD